VGGRTGRSGRRRGIALPAVIAPVLSAAAADTLLRMPTGWALVRGILFALVAAGSWIELILVLWILPRRRSARRPDPGDAPPGD
jgi:hypothetical protein